VAERLVDGAPCHDVPLDPRHVDVFEIAGGAEAERRTQEDDPIDSRLLLHPGDLVRARGAEAEVVRVIRDPEFVGDVLVGEVVLHPIYAHLVRLEEREIDTLDEPVPVREPVEELQRPFDEGELQEQENCVEAQLS